jgi:hypothetical protein
MPQPKRIIHLGSWVLLLLLNVAGAFSFFQKPGYLPIDPADVMLVRPGPNQDASAAATVAGGQGSQIAAPQPADKVLVLVHSRYRGLRLPMVCMASVLLIGSILLTRTWPANKPLPPEAA